MMRVVKRTHLAGLVAFAVSAAIAWCVVAGAHTNRSTVIRPAMETIRVELPAVVADVDIYWPDTAAPAPLVIVAHGFSRKRHNMSAWAPRQPLVLWREMV
jgi:hypothetical protein